MSTQESILLSDEEGAEHAASCDICTLAGDSEDNRLLSCQLCEVNVHQGCYSVEGIFDEDDPKWFCFPCKAGFSPKKLKCALCDHTGGAYKMVAGEGSSWVHALCLNWIPNVHDAEDDNNKLLGPKADITGLEKSRYKLLCMVCNRKGEDSGACVQCSYRNCQSAVHPMCMYRGSGQFIGRVVEGFNKETDSAYFLREPYCPRHADFIGQPPKKSGEFVIQMSLRAKFDVGEEYEIILKDKYARETFPFPTMTARQAAEKARADKKQRAGSLSSLDKGAGKVGQKRKRASTGDAPATPERTNFPRGVPSKRPKVTITKAASSSGRMQISPPRTHSGIKRGPASISATKSSSNRAPQYLSINDIVDHNLTLSSSRSPRRAARAQILVPSSPSLASVGSPEQQPRKGRTPRSTTAADESEPSTPVSTDRNGAAAAGRTSSTGRSTRFSLAGGSAEELLPGLTAVKKNVGRWAKKGAQEPVSASAGPASSVSSSSAAAQVSTTGVVPALPALGASAMSAAVDAAVVQHLQALLKQVLVGMLPTGVGAQSSAAGLPGTAVRAPPQYRFCPSSLPEDTWAELSETGWLCLTTASGGPSTSGGGGAAHSEEIYVAPGTLQTSDDVLNFSELRLKENFQYFSSLGAFRIHLAQNSSLLQPWALTWQDLQQHHGWRTYPLPSSARNSGAGSSGLVHSISRASSTGDSTVQSSLAGRGFGVDEADAAPAPQWIYLSGSADDTDRGRGTESASASFQEDSDGECDHVYGAASTRPRGSSGGGAGVKAPIFVDNCIDGVHRFKTWRELQCYIHRFPYLLQTDDKFINSLLVNGWRHRLRVKQQGCSIDMHSNYEFLWQGALVLQHSAQSETPGVVQDVDHRDGIWLSIDALRRHLWVEPTRLFRPYDHALSAIRVTAANVSTIVGSSALATVSASSSATCLGAANASPGTVSVAVAPVAQAAMGTASESDVQQLRNEFSTLLAEMAALKQSNAESLARAKKVENKLERQRERKREKRDRRRSGGVDSVIASAGPGAGVGAGAGDPHHHGNVDYAYAYGQSSGIAGMIVTGVADGQEQDQDEEDDRELESDDCDGDTV